MSRSPAFLLAIAIAAVVAPSAGATGSLLRVPHDFSTIQAAVDHAFSADTIEVSKGVYAENISIQQLSNLTLRAKGKHVVIDGSAGATALIASECPFFLMKGFQVIGGTAEGVLLADCSNSRVTKCRISGASSNSGIRANVGTKVRIDHVVVDVDGTGIQLNNEFMAGFFAGPAGPDHSRVDHCVVRRAGGNGVTINGATNVVDHVEVHDTGDFGITTLPNATLATIRDCEVVRSGKEGVALFGFVTEVIDCTVSRSAASGFSCGSNTNRLVDCRAKRCAADGFAIEPTFCGNKLVDCIATRSVADGFHIEGFANHLTRCKAKQSGGLGLDDPAGVLTTNVYEKCKFDSANAP